MDQTAEREPWEPSKKFLWRVYHKARRRDRTIQLDDVRQAARLDHLDHLTRPVDRGPLLGGRRTRRRQSDFERNYLASLHPLTDVGVRADRSGAWPRMRHLEGPAKKNDPSKGTWGERHPLPPAEPSALDHLVERERQEQIAHLLAKSGLTAVERDAALEIDRGTSKQAVWKAEERAFKKLRARATQQGWMPEAAQRTTWPKEYLVRPRWGRLRGGERWRWSYLITPYPAPRTEFEFVERKQPQRRLPSSIQWSPWRPDTRRYIESPPPLGLVSARRGPRAIVSYGRAAVSTCCIGEGGRRHDRACPAA
jgi:hypothetical protein